MFVCVVTFFSRSTESSSSSRFCSNFILIFVKWLALSSADWSSSSFCCLPSAHAFFSFCNLETNSSCETNSSFKDRICESLVPLSSSHCWSLNANSNNVIKHYNKKLLVLGKMAHSSEKGGLCLMKWPSKMLRNLTYIWNIWKPTEIFCFSISCYFIFPPNECPGLCRHR